MLFPIRKKSGETTPRNSLFVGGENRNFVFIWSRVYRGGRGGEVGAGRLEGETDDDGRRVRVT